MTAKIEIIPMVEDDWERLRALRLEMLRDSPDAYLEPLSHALATDDDGWRARARRPLNPGSAGLVAIDRELDRFVGTMSAYTDPERNRTWLVAVYVAGPYRGQPYGGQRVADRLLDGIEGWAIGTGVPRLWLEVHEANQRAQGFYRRRGFEFTGGARAWDVRPAERELEMVRELG